MLTLPEKKHIKSCLKCKKCELWVKKCSRTDKKFRSLANVTKNTYICSLHFYGESGPTTDYPDPLSIQEFLKFYDMSTTKKRQSRKCYETLMLENEGIPKGDNGVSRWDGLQNMENGITKSTTEEFVEYLVGQKVQVKVEPEDYTEYTESTPSYSFNDCVKNTPKLDTELIKKEHDSGVYEFKCELEIESTVLQKPMLADSSLYAKEESKVLNESEPQEVKCELFYTGILQGKELALSNIIVNESQSFNVKEEKPSVNSSTYKSRILKRNKNTSYSCDACGRIFLMSVTLKIHRCKYITNKSFTCKICNSKFQFRNQLILHKVMHLTEEPYLEFQDSCERKADRDLYNIDIIKRLKPHATANDDGLACFCKICDAKFPDPIELALHEIKHAGTKPFRCNICDKRFVTLRRLILHKGEDTMYKCPCFVKPSTEIRNGTVRSRGLV
ncbi:Zinc finger protein 432 [Eumeta japonica]|uniref:Zinc finger protein 432 n=1 Tax=Eumeta variegata TaxID=151549 RepID=A0A4C1TH67_EUMVA|nr:Zinc finger protein 432 [Eumeta japonica]